MSEILEQYGAEFDNDTDVQSAVKPKYMTLKGEIQSRFTGFLSEYRDSVKESITQNLLDLFKKKMLEIVGEDEYYAIQGEGTDYDEPEPNDEVNSIKQEIRDRIEESCK